MTTNEVEAPVYASEITEAAVTASLRRRESGATEPLAETFVRLNDVMIGLADTTTGATPPISQERFAELLQAAPDADRLLSQTDEIRALLRVMAETVGLERFRSGNRPFQYRFKSPTTNVAEIDRCRAYAKECIRAADEHTEWIRQQTAKRVAERANLGASTAETFRTLLQEVNPGLSETFDVTIHSLRLLPVASKLKARFTLVTGRSGVVLPECAYYVTRYGEPGAAGPSVQEGRGIWRPVAEFSLELRTALAT
ncbi:MAG TPA: hypothetical protein VK760_10145, partial [Candidatus Acidoferrales bacterium]|nr:hypothetical protein [Candidatus Acidoferrales bacterium]